jgi:ArsR family transcriptional regulator|tara:strand:- start:1251 stop:1553 length:303 start_codon:yes stop_codon:yes gene_type:complete
MSEKAYKIFFRTLANDNRLRIINLLRKDTKCVHEICKELNFNQTTVSHNLKRLLHCGFVFVEKKGKHRYYSLNKKTIKPLMSLIDDHIPEYCEKIAKGEK